MITSGLEHGSVLVACEEGAHRAPLGAFCALASLTDASAMEIRRHLEQCRRLVEFHVQVFDAMETWIIEKVRAEAWRPLWRLPLQMVREPLGQ